MAQLKSASDHARLADEQAALRRVATLVADEAAPDEIFASVAVEIARILTADRCAIGRFEADDSMTVVAYWSTEEPKVPVGTRIDLQGDDVTAAVRESGRPIVIDDHEAYSGPLIDYARTLGSLPRSTVAAPIFVEGRVWGMIFASTMVVEIAKGTESRVADFAELVATAIANTEARRELEQVANEQRALRTAATLVAAGASPNEVFTAITSAASELFEVPFASLLRYGPDGNATMVAGCAACSGFVGQSWTVPEDDLGIVRMVVGSRQPARVDDHRGVHGPLGEAARSLDIGSVVGVPVVVNGSVWGVLAVGAAQDGPPLPADASDRLVGFTELVTTTLVNAETRDSLRRLADEQAALRRVATLVAAGVEPDELFSAVSDEVAGLFEADGAGIGRFEPDGREVITVGRSKSLRRFPVGSRQDLGKSLISGEVHRTGRAARKDLRGEEAGSAAAYGDQARRILAMGFISTVAAPIVVEGELWGLVTASSTQAVLPADTENRLESFSELVATAIANAESRTELATSEARARELANEQAALKRVATLVAAGVEPNELFSAVSNEVAGLFSADWAAVGRYEPDGAGAELVGVSIDVPGITVGTRSGLDKGIVAGEIYRTGRPARNDDVEATGAFAGKAREFVALGFISTVGAPIVVEGEIWGYVAASSSRTRLPPNTEQRIGSFGELVATAIANAESRSDLATSELRARELANEQAALRRVATLVAAGVEPDEVFTAVSEEVAQLFEADGAAVGRFEPDGAGIVVVGRSRGLRGIPVGTHAAPDESPTVDDVRLTHRAARWSDKFYTSVAAPIMVGGSLWGVLTADSGGGGFPADTEERLQQFGELVATAIANTESRAALATSEARARELANEQAALRRVATLVAQGATPDQLFSAVAEEVAAIIDIPVVGVHGYEPDGTFTILGLAGQTNFTVGSRWPVEEEGIAGQILATGRPARKDDYSVMPGRLGEAVREDLMFSTVGVPIIVDGGIWGFMAAAAKPGRPIPSDTEEQLVRFTALVATAVSNATTRSELLASRARVVSAADETRRRLERDLHDGIQQWLVALALRARKAAGLTAGGESPVQELSGLADDLVAVTDELREISRGIHPAILTDAGLDDALEALARRSTVRVDLDVAFQGRFDPTLEATVYYVVAESLTNAVKHSRGIESRGAWW